MLFAPGMENTSIPQEIWEKLDNLEETLGDLCSDYLDKAYYFIGGLCCNFYVISPPEPSTFLQNLTPQKGIEAFLSRICDWAQVSNGKDVFCFVSEIMLEVLEPLHASIYTITDKAWNYYDHLLKPMVMSVSAVAICINDIWFLLMAEWSD